MVTKVDRSTTTKTTTSTHTAVVKTPKHVTEVKKADGPVPTQMLAGASKSWSALNPSTKQTSTSADPAKLWGPSQKSSVSADVAAFKKLKPDEMKVKLETIKTQRDDARTKVDARVKDLDGRWEKFAPNKKCVVLRDYERHSRKLDRFTRGKVDTKLDVAEAAQKKIDKLNRQVSELGTPKTQSKVALKEKLHDQIEALQQKQQIAVTEATTIIDQKGLKLDRLVTTEAAIDPVGAASDNALGVLVDIWNGLSELYEQCTAVYKAVENLMKQQAKQQEARREEQKADAANERDRKRIDDKRIEEKRQLKKIDEKRYEQRRILG